MSIPLNGGERPQGSTRTVAVGIPPLRQHTPVVNHSKHTGNNRRETRPPHRSEARKTEETRTPCGLDQQNSTQTRTSERRRTGQSTPTNENSQRPRNNPREAQTQPRRKKQSLKIASLNMNGNGSKKDDKWGAINNVMKQRKIAVLAVQETHPTDDIQRTIDRRFRNTLQTYHSADPEEPGARNGVSFVVNKRLVKTSNIKTRTILEGRVMTIEIPWNGEDMIRIMNVYAPAQNNAKATFWEQLLQTIELDEEPEPDMVVGDFNIVENPEIDRLANNGLTDPANARQSFSDFTTNLNLADGWRRRHPRKRSYTYIGRTQSRLDRIYAKEEMIPWCTDWKIEHPATRSDHQLISVNITAENMPYIGKGRWHIPTNLLKDRQLKKRMQDHARQLKAELNEATTQGREITNPQLALKNFKTVVLELYREHQRKTQPKIQNAIRTLQKGLDETTNSDRIPEDEIAMQTRLIKERIDALEKKRRDIARLLGTARSRLEKETMSRHWARSAKENNPRDTIRALKNPLGNINRRVTRSDEMAQLARDYHEKLLSIDRDPMHEPTAEDTETALKNITNTLSEEMIDNLRKDISTHEVERALKDSANDKSPGLDGIPTELWKLLHQQYKSANEKEKHNFCNIAEVLAHVFNDIAKHGITEGTGFNDGWMCPIYKKKEADNVANYRPITILNTDYKLFAKIIATRLSDVAPHLIHPDQAGFIRGRSIFDQIEQTSTTINYAQLKGINGAIIALDQEKAYDKVTHPYLWTVLKKLAFPDEMIRTIQTLYSDAKTSVMINGVLSEPFTVSRGVRQGDPISCILFDLAIEPLAANIRNSNIKGIEIPNLNETAKVTLFADDTTVILAENDSLDELMDILNEWCQISGAKFNVEKTEIIPLGTDHYRQNLKDTRKLNERGSSIPENIHVASDKEATRILGAWVGNDTNPKESWKPIVETITKDLTRWQTHYPTLEGKRLIIQMIAGGKTQFLTRAQGMPNEIVDQLQRVINEFSWEKKVSSMRIEDLAKEIDKGGRKVMNITARNEAIGLMWVKDYLRMGKDRPKWAYMMDEIFRSVRPKGAKETPEEIANWNPFTQEWQPKMRDKHIPKRIQQALSLAKKHGVMLETPKPNNETRLNMPVWLHRKASRNAARLYKKSEAKCLKSKHKTHYIKQLVALTERTPPNHQKNNFCTCAQCREMSKIGCTHPNGCLNMAINLIEEITATWRPSKNDEQGTQLQPQETMITLEEGEIIVENFAIPTDLENSFRIFTNQNSVTEENVHEDHAPRTQNQQETVIYTDGSCTGNGTAEARAGSGIWFGENDERNAAIRVPGKEQTNQVGELLAILHAIKTAPRNVPLRIKSDSKYAIDGLTTNAQKWEETDWIQVKHGPLFKCMTAWIRVRNATTTLQWVKGHAGVVGNEEADKLAAQGAQKEPERNSIDLTVPRNTVTTGAKLNKMTQSAIYKHLISKKDITRKSTERSLNSIREATKNIFGTTPTEEAIWRSVRHKDNTKKVRDFLWKQIHGIYRLGTFWLNIPECDDRAVCPLCEETETFQHIIESCRSTETTVIWQATNELWKRKYDENLTITEGAILGCGLANFTKEDGKPNSAKNRLYRILISEAAHLIWVLRCERRIKGIDSLNQNHLEKTVRKRWYSKINERMQVDCLLTNRYLYERKALKARAVYNTWEKLSSNKEDLHREWCRRPGVLVGKEPAENG